MANNQNNNITWILMLSALINLALLSYVANQFDLLSSILYLSITYLISKAKIFKELSGFEYLILGALIPTAYNVIGVFAGFFAIDALFRFIIPAATQQAILTFLIFKIWGVK